MEAIPDDLIVGCQSSSKNCMAFPLRLRAFVVN